MLRVRFYVPNPPDLPEDKVADYRPIKWPIPHPYWCSGSSEDASILVAYADSVEQIMEFWPDAIDIDVMDDNATIQFSGRFPKPNWYVEKPQ